jgi:hypothetical protein
MSCVRGREGATLCYCWVCGLIINDVKMCAIYAMISSVFLVRFVWKTYKYSFYGVVIYCDMKPESRNSGARG